MILNHLKWRISNVHNIKVLYVWSKLDGFQASCEDLVGLLQVTFMPLANLSGDVDMRHITAAITGMIIVYRFQSKEHRSLLANCLYAWITKTTDGNVDDAICLTLMTKTWCEKIRLKSGLLPMPIPNFQCCNLIKDQALFKQGCHLNLTACRQYHSLTWIKIPSDSNTFNCDINHLMC